MTLDNPALPGRGETLSGYYGGATDADGNTITYTTSWGDEYEGMEKWFWDKDWGSTNPTKPFRSRRMVKCRLVRNTSDNIILPKHLVVLASDAAGNGQTAVAGPVATARVTGYGRDTDCKCYPVDEFLPSSGVIVNDLFWIVLEGPAMCLTDLADNDAHIQQGMLLFGAHTQAAALATSTATSAGRVNDGVLLTALQATGATTGEAVYHSQLLLGQAMSTIASTWTGTDVLVDVGNGRF